MERPNIIFVLLDDVGWNDLGYNSKNSPIPTPFIDELALGDNAAYFLQYYVHSLCSPTRAALLTGRYSVNAGLPYVIVPGSPAGIDLNAETLPIALRSRAGYMTAMSGKWHLGHSKKIQTPVGRGFDVFTGIYTWDADSYTKEVFTEPVKPALMIDWVREFSNGTYIHYAEPRHSTEAITAEAESMMIQHSEVNTNTPLFLYVAYTAAHSPLQPIDRHTVPCTHIPHLWRRQFCGMVVGADEGLRNLTTTALKFLGNNTILIVSSDNGASTWFGGMNQPFKGAKTTPYEGGTRVPAFIVDFSEESKYLGRTATSSNTITAGQGPDGSGSSVAKSYGHSINFMVHVADWMPTLLAFAGVSQGDMPDHMDGIDMSNAFRESRQNKGVNFRSDDDLTKSVQPGFEFTPALGPRTEMLLELLTADDALFEGDLYAFREGDWKLIHGRTRDPLYYYESGGLMMNTSSTGMVVPIAEAFLRAAESLFGAGRFDTSRGVLIHRVVHSIHHDPADEDEVKLFNITGDPLETTNLAASNQDVVERLLSKVMAIKSKIPVKINMRLQFEMEKVWPSTFVAGDCSMNSHIAPENCRFTHPWIPDDVDQWSMDNLVDSIVYTDQKLTESFTAITIATLLGPLIAIAIALRCCFRRGS